MVSRFNGGRVEDMYVFNHEDRRCFGDEVVLFERGWRQGSLVEILLPIWGPPRQKCSSKPSFTSANTFLHNENTANERKRRSEE